MIFRNTTITIRSLCNPLFRRLWPTFIYFIYLLALSKCYKLLLIFNTLVTMSISTIITYYNHILQYNIFVYIFKNI